MKKVIVPTCLWLVLLAFEATAQTQPSSNTHTRGSGTVRNKVTEGKAPSGLGTAGSSGASGRPQTYTRGPSTRRSHDTGVETGSANRTKATRTTTRTRSTTRSQPH